MLFLYVGEMYPDLDDIKRRPFYLPPMTSVPRMPALTETDGERSTNIVSASHDLGHLLGYRPCHTTCPYCSRDIETKTYVEDSQLAIKMFGIMCFMGCCCCACIPLCLQSLHEVTHQCPKCRMILGVYSPSLWMSDVSVFVSLYSGTLTCILWNFMLSRRILFF